MSENQFVIRLRAHLHRMGAAYLVLAISLIPTSIAYHRVQVSVEERDQARFDQAVAATKDTIERRIERDVDEFLAMRGFFDVSGLPDRAGWQRYLTSIEIARRFPGIHALGYLEKVTEEEKPAHIARMLATGFPRYRILADKARPVYYPTVYLNQFEEQTSGEIGVDAYSYPASREALDLARDSGKAAAAGKVSGSPSEHAAHKANLIIYLPVYRQGAPSTTVEERRAALQGFIYGTFVVEKLLLGIFSRHGDFTLDLEVYEGPVLKRERLLHNHPRLLFSEDASFVPRFTRTVTAQVVNRRWNLKFTALPAFESESQQHLPRVVLFGGLTVNLLLFGISWAQSNARLVAEKLTEDLRRIHERDRLLERATNDAIWDWDVLTNKLQWNEAVQAMFGYSRDKLEPKIEWWKERLHPDDRRRIFNGRDAALQTGGEFWADEYRFRRGDGTYADVIDRGYIIHDNQGVPVRMIGSMVDITGRKQAEEAQARSERKLDLLAKHTPLAVIMWNVDFQVTEWNPGAERIFGYTAAEAVGHGASELIVPESAQPHVNRVWQNLISLSGRRTTGSDDLAAGRRSINENRTKDGRSITCDWYNTPLIDTNGQVIGVASLVLDITESRRVSAALAAETERLAITLRSIGEGVIVTDTAGKIILLNKMAEHLCGRTQATALGCAITEVFHILHGKARATAEDPVSQVLGAEGVIELVNRQAILTRDGIERSIAYSCSPISNAESKIIGTVLVFRDITEEQRTADELLRAGKLESVGILAGGIAHDFNNIMTAVIGNLSLAKMFAHPGDKIYVRLEEAEKASLRTKDLTQQLLTFSKGGAPVKATASIGELIQGSSDFALHGSNVRGEFTLPAELWAVEVDQGQFSQVMHNLVINAMQAMPDGGTVEVRAQNTHLDAKQGLPLTPGRYVRVSVADHGIGIKPEHLSKIFDPYFTTKETGNGLGLATSYSIIKKHDGLITVESTPGVGTAFHVFLPASHKAVPPPPPPTSEPVSGHGRILVMDDEAIIRQLTMTVLAHLGYEVETVADGAACIQAYTEARDAGRPFTALIMDLTIPGGMGGKEAIKRLREIDPHVRAIVSSGYSSGPEMANFRQHGFRGMVAKPYKIEELAKALQAVIADGKT